MKLILQKFVGKNVVRRVGSLSVSLTLGEEDTESEESDIELQASGGSKSAEVFNSRREHRVERNVCHYTLILLLNLKVYNYCTFNVNIFIVLKF